MAKDDLFGMLMGLDDTAVVRDHVQRAAFGWMGGKSRSVNEITEHLPYRHTFVDVFGGSGIITLNRQASTLDVYNDRYSGVVAFYRCIRDPAKVDLLIQRIELCVHAREEFVWCRDTWENCDDDVERAARWYYMLQCSFTNKCHAFARATNSASPIKIRTNLHLFPAIHYRFADVQVENLDFKTCMRDYDSPETVFYCDPPYLGVDSGIYVHKFKRSDHIELLETIFRMQGYVAVSSYKNDLYESYDWDRIFEWQIPVTSKALAFVDTNQQANETGRSRDYATETLYIKE